MLWYRLYVLLLHYSSIQSDLLSHYATISAKEAIHKNASVHAKSSFSFLIPPTCHSSKCQMVLKFKNN